MYVCLYTASRSEWKLRLKKNSTAYSQNTGPNADAGLGQRKKKAAMQEVMQKVVVLFIRCTPFSIASSTVFAINK